MAIKNGDKIRAHYTGTLNDGTEFDSSRNRDPITFIVGDGTIIPGFEKAVLGHKIGDKVKVRIPPEEAYGNHDPELIFTVEPAQMPDNIPLEIGTPLHLANDQGTMDAIITDIDLENITLDANHPLAGKELIFEIEIIAVN